MERNRREQESQRVKSLNVADRSSSSEKPAQKENKRFHAKPKNVLPRNSRWTIIELICANFEVTRMANLFRGELVEIDSCIIRHIALTHEKCINVLIR